VIDKPSLKFNS
jgi:hypothetical protein